MVPVDRSSKCDFDKRYKCFAEPLEHALQFIHLVDEGIQGLRDIILRCVIWSVGQITNTCTYDIGENKQTTFGMTEVNTVKQKLKDVSYNFTGQVIGKPYGPP